MSKKITLQHAQKLDDGTRVGFIVVSKTLNEETGEFEPFVDYQNDHLTDECISKMVGKLDGATLPLQVSHSGEVVGKFTEIFALTEERAKALGLSATRLGIVAVAKLDNPEEFVQKHGDLAAFSMGGLLSGRRNGGSQ